MQSRRVHLTLALIVGGSLVASSCTSAVDKAGGEKVPPALVLHVLNTRDSEELQPFVDKVTQLSKGGLRLQVETKWHKTSLAGERDAIHATQAGQTDLAVVPVRAWHGVGVTSFDALIAPLTVDSLALQQKVLATSMPTDMLKGLSRLNLTGIGVLPGPMRKPAGITRSLLGPADYRGAQIGDSPSAIGERSLLALGSVPVLSTFEGTPVDSLDGIENQLNSVSGNQYDGVVRTITANVNLWPRPLVIVAGPRAVHRLSAAQLAVLRAATRAALAPTTREQIQSDAEGMGQLCRRGELQFIDATPTDLTQLRTAFRPVLSWLRQDTTTSTYLDRINGLRDGVEPYDGEAVRCPPTEAAPSRTVTPVDGVYEVDIAAADGRTSGAPEPENYGHYRWILNRGQWEQTQRSDRASTWATGHYTVKDDVLTLVVDQSGGIAPTNANDKPGDSSTFRWSIYHDELSLRPADPKLKPSQYPFSYTIKPWRRLGLPEAGMTPASEPSPTPTGSQVTAFDGAYKVVFTEQEARATDPNVPPENWGTFIYVFVRGRFGYTQEDASACTWGYGRFTVTGQRVEWLFEDGGGIAPSGAQSKPGEDFAFGWSRYHDELSLSAVPGAVSPSLLLMKPMHRLTQRPSSSLLSRRCPPPAGALRGK